MAQEFRRILIVRTDRIGDVILTLPMARALKERYPDASIAMLIRQYTSELVSDHTAVDRMLLYDENGQLHPFFHLVRLLRKEQFDIVFHTYPRFRLALMMWFAGIPVRVGTGYRWYSFLFNRRVYEHRKDAKRHELEYNLNLLSAIGYSVNSETLKPVLDVNSESLKYVKNVLVSNGIADNNRFVILHPGSGGSARDWSAKNFGLLAKRLSQLPEIKVVVTGSKNERELVEQVRSFAGDSVIPLVGLFNLKEYSALTKLSAVFVSNSTGPIHVAAATGTPIVGLYPQVTALSAKRWGPYTEKKTVFTPLNKPSDCNKCVAGQQDICECMETICVDDVYTAVVEQLGMK